MKFASPRRRSVTRPPLAFSLVELLVVIAVISILLTILVPSLQQAKEMTRRTLCAANLRVCGNGLSAYAREYGRYPHQRQGTYNLRPTLPLGGPYPDRYYRGPLAIPMEQNVGWEWDEVIRLGIDDGYVADATVPFSRALDALSCPSLKDPNLNELPSRDTYWPNGSGRCGWQGTETPTAYNWYLGYMYVGGSEGWIHESPAYSPRFMRNPGDWAIMVDKLFLYSTEDYWVTGHAQGKEPAGFNTLFHDQHVAWYPWADGENAVMMNHWGTRHNYWRRRVDSP